MKNTQLRKHFQQHPSEIYLLFTKAGWHSSDFIWELVSRLPFRYITVKWSISCTPHSSVSTQRLLDPNHTSVAQDILVSGLRRWITNFTRKQETHFSFTQLLPPRQFLDFAASTTQGISLSLYGHVHTSLEIFRPIYTSNLSSNNCSQISNS